MSQNVQPKIQQEVRCSGRHCLDVYHLDEGMHFIQVSGGNDGKVDKRSQCEILKRFARHWLGCLSFMTHFQNSEDWERWREMPSRYILQFPCKRASMLLGTSCQVLQRNSAKKNLVGQKPCFCIVALQEGQERRGQKRNANHNFAASTWQCRKNSVLWDGTDMELLQIDEMPTKNLKTTRGKKKKR